MTNLLFTRSNDPETALDLSTKNRYKSMRYQENYHLQVSEITVQSQKNSWKFEGKNQNPESYQSAF